MDKGRYVHTSETCNTRKGWSSGQKKKRKKRKKGEEKKWKRERSIFEKRVFERVFLHCNNHDPHNVWSSPLSLSLPLCLKVQLIELIRFVRDCVRGWRCTSFLFFINIYLDILLEIHIFRDWHGGGMFLFFLNKIVLGNSGRVSVSTFYLKNTGTERVRSLSYTLSSVLV